MMMIMMMMRRRRRRRRKWKHKLTNGTEELVGEDQEQGVRKEQKVQQIQGELPPPASQLTLVKFSASLSQFYFEIDPVRFKL